jgi:predicted transcriptional regulator
MRVMNTRKTRHQFYLPDDLSEALENLAAKPGASKTTVLAEALRAWLDRKAVNELDERFAPRLDRQQRMLQRVETTLNMAAEVLDLFVQHQLTIVAHQPPFDQETGQLGLKRYRAFMDQVGRRLATNQGKPRLTTGATQSGEIA